MKEKIELSPLIKTTLRLRQELSKSSYDVDDLMRIYATMNITNYFENNNNKNNNTLKRNLKKVI